MRKAKHSRNTGNRTNHPKNSGAFKPGKDSRRHTAGQVNAAAVAVKRTFREVLIAIGDEDLPGEFAGKPVTKKKIEWLGAKLWQAALDGELSAIRELLDRMFGKPAQTLEHTTPIDQDGKPTALTIEVVHIKPVAGAPGNGGNGDH